ncbi:hypothetical protein CPBF426_35970 [Xanthomonas arboricola pv. juglandis]|nr:hypothetical protein CPBF426_35970 [Xanthomonas arboricola pv. juglandis]
MAVFCCTPTRPRSVPRPALAARALQGTRAQLCLLAPAERCLKASLNFFETFSGHGNNVQSGSVAGDWRRAAQGCAAAASQTGCLPSRGADPRPRCRPHRSEYRQASCFAVPSPQPLSRRERGFKRRFISLFKLFRSCKQRAERQRGRELAESGTRMCRGGESDRMSAEPRSRSPAALPPSPKPATERWRWIHPRLSRTYRLRASCQPCITRVGDHLPATNVVRLHAVVLYPRVPAR